MVSACDNIVHVARMRDDDACIGCRTKSLGLRLSLDIILLFQRWNHDYYNYG